MEHPAQRVAGGRHAQRAEGAATDDRLDVNRLAGPIDTTLGEHRGSDRQPVAAPGRAHVELPGRELARPGVDRDDRPIERQAGRHVAHEPAPGLFIGRVGVAQAREPDKALRVGRPARPHAPTGIAQLDCDTGLRHTVLHARHPDDRFLISDARRDTKVCRL